MRVQPERVESKGRAAGPGLRLTSLRQAWRRGPGRSKKIAMGSALVVLVAGISALVGGAAYAANPCAPVVNPIACENSLPGNPESDWDINNAGDSSIQGFSTDISVNLGQQIGFKINTDSHNYNIKIFRLGYYQNGDGARLITTINPSVSLPQTQPACVTSTATEIYDCGTWAVSATWTVPTTQVSGIYIALLHRNDGSEGSSQIPFIVRNDASHSAILFQASDTTWQAYNSYGGSSFYVGAANGRGYKLSYNRPFATRGDNDGRDYLFSNEYPMLRFLEKNGYDVSYSTDTDSDRHGDLIKNHKVFMSVGHDEYWSYTQRANVEAARDAGVNLAFFSGNEVYWRTRWEASQDGSNTAYRTLVSYKETWDNAKIDPTTQWTGTYRDPRFSPPAIGGGQPENALTGTLFKANHDDLALQVPAAQGQYRLWRNTTVATQSVGATATLAAHTVGYESDEDLDNGFRPAGLIDLSTTVGPTPQYLTDFGSTVVAQNTTHHLTLYRAPSGALVFSAGTIQFAWGLDADHDGETPPAADSRMQQATVNLLADMGAQPATLMTGLFAASASTDSQGPTTTITTPVTGASVANGAAVSVAGTAADLGGGKVAGVEVSIDGGTTWHPAVGTTSWTYSFNANAVATQVIKARAVDDSANIGAVGTPVSISTTGPNSLFGNKVPGLAAAADTSGVELGVRVVPQQDGNITGVRFYKGTGNSGTHLGTLWTAGGTQLATGTFSGESASGWQTLTFTTPVAVSAGTTYIASYWAPNGHYAADDWFFSYADYKSGPLVAPRAETSGGNGIYATSHGFPTQTFGDDNYYVDVLFVPGDGVPPTVLTVSPAASATNVDLATAPSATFSKGMNASTIAFTLKAGGTTPVVGTTTYNATTNVATFTPTAPLATAQSYTASVTGSDSSGGSMASPMTWTFTTTSYASVATLFTTNATPGNATSNDPNAVELGVKFSASTDGQVVGVRYYQGPGNTGTHTGSLYSSTGSLLARATFGSGTGNGWQSVYFSAPVTVTAGTTYVAAYYAPNGNYAFDAGYFNSAVTNAPLTAPGGSNGVYVYGSDAYPTNSWASTNYWVDPLFVSSGGSGPSPSPTPTPSPTPSVPAGTVSLFASSSTPTNANWNDNNAIEVGVRFTSDVAGQALGVKFYKGAQNTGTHTGSLWSSTGTLLATVTFAGESASGWQTALFSTPVTLTVGTTYVVSYHSTVGFYAVNANQFTSPYDNAPLHVAVTGGSYLYGSGFPASTVNHNYWVDVLFKPS
jgi:hypothetical protein